MSRLSPRPLYALLPIVATMAGCWSVSIVPADTGDAGDSGSSQDVLVADVVHVDVDAAVQDADAGMGSLESGAGDGPTDPLDAAIAALCAHIAQFPCWETSLASAVQATAAGSCDTLLRLGYVAACDAPWFAWAECLTAGQPDCATCNADASCSSGCPTSASCDALCPQEAAALAACSAPPTTKVSATSDRAACDGVQGLTDCDLTCTPKGVPPMTVSCSRVKGDADPVSCTCMRPGGSSLPWGDARHPPGYATGGGAYFTSCQDAAQQFVDGQFCDGLLDCCFAGTVHCDQGYPCVQDCACVGDPRLAGFATCDEFAQANEATPVSYCTTLVWRDQFRYATASCFPSGASPGLPAPYAAPQLCPPALPTDSPRVDCSVSYQGQLSDDGKTCTCDGGHLADFGPCYCVIDQLTGDASQACRNDPGDIADDGWCYIDPVAGLGSSDLVQMCPGERPRRLRFTGASAHFNEDTVPPPSLSCGGVCSDGDAGADGGSD